MYKLLPIPKKVIIDEESGSVFEDIIISFKDCSVDLTETVRKIIHLKMDGLPGATVNFNTNPHTKSLIVNIYNKLNVGEVDEQYHDLFLKQGYIIHGKDNIINIYFAEKAGILHAFSSLKQIIKKNTGGGFTIPDFYILDYPEVEQRALSPTFAWYAGYGRVGFDMQLWDFNDWKSFLDYCSDFKINQLNLCMYGYWPFEFKEYPETTLKDFKMKVWNEESKNRIEIRYTHPNIVKEFLPDLICYAHDLSINIHAYIGLNSYSGGYANIYRGKRMQMPQGSKFINDFDTLCLSDKDTIEYLKASVRRITGMGFDGIIFEESEEAFWFCNCEKCKTEYLDNTKSAGEAKHLANYGLLKILHKEIKSENPECRIGLRAWREPPLEKDPEYLKKCEESIPKDVSLYWAPGLYVGEEEFEKWVSVFGKDRICARDTEANAISSCMGRLYRIFNSNILRSAEEINQQNIDNDIRQHKGSAKAHAKGINGYMFEFYGFFLHFFVHAGYGWNPGMEGNDFYNYAIEAVFGEELKDDILFILKNILTIHESQVSIFTSEFPFQRNRVQAIDINAIEHAKMQWPNILNKIASLKNKIENDEKLKVYYKHFDKIENAHKRNLYIYEMCLSSIKYNSAVTEQEKHKYLKEMDYYNEKDFSLARTMFFDTDIIDASGTKVSMFPYHEIKRVIQNLLNPDNQDNRQIYLGVEALGWLWL
jgi:hypothetical protein